DFTFVVVCARAGGSAARPNVTSAPRQRARIASARFPKLGCLRLETMVACILADYFRRRLSHGEVRQLPEVATGREAPNEESQLHTHRVRDRQDTFAVEITAGGAAIRAGGDRGQQQADRCSLPVASRDGHARATLEMHPPSPSIGEDGAGSAEPAPETRFNHG